MKLHLRIHRNRWEVQGKVQGKQSEAHKNNPQSHKLIQQISPFADVNYTRYAKISLQLKDTQNSFRLLEKGKPNIKQIFIDHLPF